MRSTLHIRGNNRAKNNNPDRESSRFRFFAWPYHVENKGPKYLYDCAAILAFKLRVRAVLKPGYLVNVP
jgi:hypothetical protein